MNYSKEEKKAIEEVKRELTNEDRREYMSSWFAKDLDIILNLISKQQKEIEEKDRLIDKQREKTMYYKMLQGENKRLN